MEKIINIDAILPHPELPERDSIGNEDGLRESMAGPNGQLQAITVDSQLRLILGRRRLAMAKELGWDNIRARVIDLDDPITAVRDENDCRVELTPSEATRIAILIERREAEKAKERHNEGSIKGGKTPKIKQPSLFPPQKKTAYGIEEQGSGNLPEPCSTDKNHGSEEASAQNREEVRAKDIAAEAADMSRHTYEKAKEIVEAADAGDPAAQEAMREMDENGKVGPAHAKMKIKRMQDAVGNKDRNGTPIPERCKEAFASIAYFRRAAITAREAKNAFLLIEELIDHFRSHGQRKFSTLMDSAKQLAELLCPAVLCPLCKGHGCEKCENEGFLREGEINDDNYY